MFIPSSCAFAGEGANLAGALRNATNDPKADVLHQAGRFCLSSSSKALGVDKIHRNDVSAELRDRRKARDRPGGELIVRTR